MSVESSPVEAVETTEEDKYIMSTNGKLHYRSTYKASLNYYYAHREQILAKARERYDTDPEYRNHVSDRISRSYRKHRETDLGRRALKKDIHRVEKHLERAIDDADKERERLKLNPISLYEHVVIDSEDVI